MDFDNLQDRSLRVRGSVGVVNDDGSDRDSRNVVLKDVVGINDGVGTSGVE